MSGVNITSNHIDDVVTIGEIDDFIFSCNQCNNTTTITLSGPASSNVAIVSNVCANTFTITSGGIAFINKWAISGNTINAALNLSNVSVNQNSSITGNVMASFSSTPGFNDSIFSNNQIKLGKF